MYYNKVTFSSKIRENIERRENHVVISNYLDIASNLGSGVCVDIENVNKPIATPKFTVCLFTSYIVGNVYKTTKWCHY